MPAVFQGVKYNQRKSNLSLRLQIRNVAPWTRKIINIIYRSWVNDIKKHLLYILWKPEYLENVIIWKCCRRSNISKTKAKLLEQQTITPLGRGLLGQKVSRNPFSLHPSGEHLVWGLFVRHIGTLLLKKLPSKNLPRDTKKTGDLWLSTIKINYITGNHQKEYKKLHIRLSNSFLFFKTPFLS